jgi:hypothetical protein
MGLLDDAIREHLDLKRRRGADPSEVARLEQEALGPVRREPAAAEPASVADGQPPPAQEPLPAEPEPAPAPAEPHAAASQPLDEGLPPDEATHVLTPEERHDPPHGDPLVEHEHPEPIGEAAVPSGADPEHATQRPPAEDPRDSDIVHQPTTEFRVEDHHHDDDGEDAAQPQHQDDVLEETPEFLQETPEHDRLWFEQRPPRDFDFDG